MLGVIVAAMVLVAVGALVLWWANACRHGTFGRQRVLGYRTLLTLRDKDAWTAAHRAAAPLMFVAGGGVVVIAIGGAILSVAGVDFAPSFLGIAVGWLLLWLLLGFIPAVVASHAYKRSTSAP